MRFIYVLIILLSMSFSLADNIPTCIVSIDASESGIKFPIEVVVPGEKPDAKITHNPFTHNLWQSSDNVHLTNSWKVPLKKRDTMGWGIVRR